MKRTLFGICVLAGGLGLFAACSDSPTVVQKNVTPSTPQFDVTVPANGSGACMGNDAFASGFTSGMGSASDLNCTANDIDIAFATVTEYSFTSSAGPFTALPSGTSLECTGGQTIYVRTHAFLQNNAQSRYDVGLWIATDGGDAVTGTCNQYNLIPNQSGASSLEVPAQQDQCGDMAQGSGLVDVNLDVLTLTCPTSGATALSVGACVGWQNSDDFNQRGLCPTTPPGGATGFRLGTVPETKAKCNCEPFTLPVVVRASLTLVKTITNDNGGTATVSSFPLTATGPNTISGVSGTTAVTARPVLGGTYALSEQTVANYTAGSWSCTGGTQSGSNITVTAGGAATCTINNNDNPAHLTLVKVVTNDNGGTATVANFPLTAAGPVTISGTSGSGAVTNAIVSAGVYNLSEMAVAGYTASAWSCTSGGSGSQVTLALGGSATCTIGNNDNPASLTLVKVVTNDNGGTATVANFPLTAAGPVTISGTSGSGAVTNATVSAGVYNLSETTLAGYTPTAWSCTSGGSGSQVTIALGGSSTCTIGNNDNPAHLTLVKVVTNDNGGTATVANFPLSAAGPVTISGTSGSGSVTNAIVNAGVYNLSETTLAGYTPSAWSCTSGGSGSTVTLGLGGSSTCTIGNNDQPATLTLVKKVIGAGGFTFTFNLTGTTPTSTTLAPATDGQSSTTFNNVSAGSKTITEVLPNAGYILTDIGCARAPSTTPFVTGNTTTGLVSFSLGLGDNVTCTYVNQKTSLTTRTLGFWQTHLEVTYIVWFGGDIQGTHFNGISSVLDNSIGGCRTISDIGDLMGGFWASIAKTTTGGQRSDVDRARMRLLQQLLAAELNYAAFGSLPTGGLATFTAAENAYCSGDITLMNQYAGILATFNESGDTGAFDTGFSASAKDARAIADLQTWDVLP